MEQVGSQDKKKRKIVAVGLLGNALEWYDFAIYGFFAPILAKSFFPSDDPTASLIAAYGAFAAGFLMRPVGAVLFGHIGDRLGRKHALLLSVMMMAIPSLLIGLMPTFDQIGIAAGVILVILRMLQGVAVGGEYTGSVVYLAENSPPERRGLFSSLALLGAIGGMLFGSFIGTIVSFLLTDAQLQSWGWRLPFLGGVGLAVFGLFLRRGMTEEKSSAPVAFPLGHAIRYHWPQVLLVFGLNIGYAVVFYTAFVFMIGWLVSTMHETHALAMGINTIGLVLMCVLIPITAYISDRIGRRPVMLLGAVLLVILPYPLSWLMMHPQPVFALLGQLGFVVAIAIYVGPIPALLTELFPAHIRVTAVSVGYNLAFAVFGGTSPIVATWLISQSGSDIGFAWYLSAISVLSLISVLMMQKVAGDPKLND